MITSTTTNVNPRDTAKQLMEFPQEKDLVKLDIVPDSEKLHEIWKEKVTEDFNNFSIEIPESEFMQKGSRTGYHTEYFGYILCELQYMQRTYPNCVW